MQVEKVQLIWVWIRCWSEIENIFIMNILSEKFKKFYLKKHEKKNFLKKNKNIFQVLFMLFIRFQTRLNKPVFSSSSAVSPLFSINPFCSLANDKNTCSSVVWDNEYASSFRDSLLDSISLNKSAIDVFSLALSVVSSSQLNGSW